ncbi:MAG TPA: hypothetical protein PLQ97_04180 [Myxococcota bacterium]|nr:hypothetical protein [Myxococcota bacterium]HQK49944.1 hypothetical protein [Myxococcota bacterium]
MPGRLTRRSWLTGAWLRPPPAPPVPWVPVEAGSEAPEPQATEPDAGQRRVPVAIDPQRCMPFCLTCIERCPVPGALSPGRRGPILDPRSCNGCGVCLHVCPSPGRPLVAAGTR